MSDLRDRLLGLLQDQALVDRVRRQAEDLPDMAEHETDAEELRNGIDAMRRWSPEESYSEELRVRLQGSLPEGGLPVELGDKLLRPLQDAISEVAEDHVPLMLVDVSHGSTVLHLQPVHQEVVTVNGVPVDTSTADAAVRKALELFQAIERNDDLARWASVFPSFEKLTDALQSAHVTAGFLWRSHAGEVRSAALTEEGMAYFKDRASTEPRDVERPINGRVTELRESGVVKVKMGPRHNDPAEMVHFVDTGALLAMHLQLGDQVHWLVATEERADSYGVVRTKKTRFLRVVPRDAQPLTDDF